MTRRRRRLLLAGGTLVAVWFARNPGAATLLVVLLATAALAVRRWRWWRRARRRWVSLSRCARCGTAIARPSRARFCSNECRRLAQLERRAAQGDEQAAGRLALQQRLAEYAARPELDEIPF